MMRFGFNHLFLSVFCLFSGLVQVYSASGETMMYRAERIQLQTDRDIYIAGENLYYHAVLTSSDQTGYAMQSGILYLVLRNHNGQVHRSAHRVQNRRSDGLIYLHDTLPSGYYELFAFTNWMRNSGEKSFACKTIFIANRFDRTLEALITSSKDDNFSPDDVWQADGASLQINHPTEAGRREKVTISIQAEQLADGPVFAGVSVARHATRIQPFVEPTPSGQPTDMAWFTTPDEPDYYMETANTILSGSVSDILGKAIAEDMVVIINTPDTLVNLLYTKTKSDGSFHLALPQAYHNRPLYLSARTAAMEGAYDIILWDRYEINRPFHPDTFMVPASMRQHIHMSQDIVRATIVYQQHDTVEAEDTDEAQSLPVRLYAEPLVSYKLKEYNPFDDLQDIAREIIPAWRIRQSDGHYRSTLICADTRVALPGSPVFFLDGIMVDDLNKLMFLHSGLLDRIELNHVNWVAGDLSFPGIIALFSDAGEYLKVVSDLAVVRTTLSFSEIDRVFVPPSHEEKEVENDSPDLRQLLHWQPKLTLEKGQTTEVSFFTGDLAGTYLISVEGVTAGGKKVSAYASILVK